jgi:hypothetical protein
MAPVSALSPASFLAVPFNPPFANLGRRLPSTLARFRCPKPARTSQPHPMVCANLAPLTGLAQAPAVAATMSGNVAYMTDVFGGTFLFNLVPCQRPYEWEEDNAEKLLTDILDNLGSVRDRNEIKGLDFLSLGLITLCDAGTEPSANCASRRSIVDGQQRVVTLALLLAALSFRLMETGQPAHAATAEHLAHQKLCLVRLHCGAYCKPLRGC